MTQPLCIIAVHDKATSLPVFGLTNFGISTLDSDEVLLQGIRIPLRLTVDDLIYREMRPSGLGMGLQRRECSFSIKEGGPFSIAPFVAQIYSAGASVGKFFFSVWMCDVSHSLKDIAEVSTFLGYFDLDAGLGWDESNLATTIHLVERLTMLTTRYSAGIEDAEALLAGSEWQHLLEAPAYLGHHMRVPAYGRAAAQIGGFETYNKAVLGVIAGLVQSSILDGTSIPLGKSPTLGSIVGDVVKLKMGNGCIIQGTITDLGDGEYGIDTTGLSVGVAWANVTVYNKGWTATGDPVTQAKTDLSSVFLDNSLELDVIPSPTMYLKTSGTELYNGGPVSVGALFCKLTGIKDEANKELSCELLKDPANTNYKYGGVTVEFDAVQQSITWSDAADLHLNYAKWLNKQSCALYFSNKTFVLADIQKQGMPWELIITPHVNAAVPLEHVYYIKLVNNSTIAETTTGTLAIYADDGTALTPIADSDIDSITYNCGDYAVPDLCRIKMKKRITDINEAYDENLLYVDTSRALHAAEVITYIMDQAGIDTALRGYSLRSGTNLLGNPMSVKITTETWTELLESVVFESGLTVNSEYGFYDARTAFDKTAVRTFNNTADPTQTFMLVDTVGVVPFSDVVDGTYKMDIGRTYTNIDADGREFVRTHYTFQYQYSSYHGAKMRKLQSTKAVKNNDRKVDYTFKHLFDTPTATAAATQMTRIGHVANIPETTRTITVGLPLCYTHLQVLDSVYMAGFRHVSALDDPLPAYDDASAVNPVYTLSDQGPCAKYTAAVPYMLMPGIGIVDALEFNLSGTGTPVTLTFKQVQVATTSNLRSVAEKIELNEATENPTGIDAATETTRPDATYMCMRDHAGGAPAPTVVVINAGDVKPSGVTIADPCCNSTTSDGDSESDGGVTVICTEDGGYCHPDDTQCEWPDGCLDDVNVRYEYVDGDTIKSTDPILIDLYQFGDTRPVLVSLSYIGQSSTDTCVTYSIIDAPADIRFARLIVYPCVFAAPANMYGKVLQLIFHTTQCISSWPNGRWNPPHNTYVRRTFYLAIPVQLRPVSDIEIS